MESICNDEAIGFELTNGFIRIFFHKEVIMDYFLSEKGGNWQPRYNFDIEEILRQQVELDKEDYKLLTKVVMQLSQLGKGAMLIIADKPDNMSTHYSTPCLQSVESLEKAVANSTIYSLASYDGAVVLTKNQKTNRLKVCNFGVILSPASDINCNDDYFHLLQYSNSGSRHEKAVRHAYDNPEDCIIVISENRSVSILKGKKPILWRDTKVDEEMLSRLKNEEKL